MHCVGRLLAWFEGVVTQLGDPPLCEVVLGLGSVNVRYLNLTRNACTDTAHSNHTVIVNDIQGDRRLFYD